jgi:hypothetical protein
MERESLHGELGGGVKDTADNVLNGCFFSKLCREGLERGSFFA